MKTDRLKVFLCALSILLFMQVGMDSSWSSAQVPQTPLPGNGIPKYVDPLPHFAGVRVDGTKSLVVSMHEFQQQVLPSTFVYPAPFTGTYVWGYKIETRDSMGNTLASYGPLYPTFTIEAQRGVPTTVKYVNKLQRPGGLPPFLQSYITFDQTLHWANPLGLAMDDPARFQPYNGPAPAVVHLHGGEVPSEFDGGPDQWMTPTGLKGPGYRTLNLKGAALKPFGKLNPGEAIYQYPNTQDPTTLWFHDHTLGGTRLNVYAGLAGFYFLRDWYDADQNPDGLVWPDLPGGPLDTTVVDDSNPQNPRVIKPEIEIVIQDRMFDTNGQWLLPDIGDNPEHPFWIPEFLGDVIVVNGKTWPYLNVEPRRYRFRFLNGSNARFYEMWLQNDLAATPGPAFWQIGSDGGLLDFPVKIDPADPMVPRFFVFAPGERCDIIIDFAGFQGQTLTLHNKGRAPYPKGETADPQTNGQIMQFRVQNTVTGNGGVDPSYDPASGDPLRPPMPVLNPASATVTRQLTLNEVMAANGPLEALVNNSKWAGKRPDGSPIPGSQPDGMGNYRTELPVVGSTELWEVTNLTGDAHPIHLHLIQFQLISRQSFNVNTYTGAYDGSFPGGGLDPMTGMPYPPGVYIPAFGPPLPYNVPNADGAVGGNPAISPYLQGMPMPPEPNETGWKDTIIMYPGQVTRLVAKFAAQDGSPFAFDATGQTPVAVGPGGKSAKGPGYVWHCHIVDHEDNEMMRPYIPVPAP